MNAADRVKVKHFCMRTRTASPIIVNVNRYSEGQFTHQLDGDNSCGANSSEGGEGSTFDISTSSKHDQILIIREVTHRLHRCDSFPRWQWYDLSNHYKQFEDSIRTCRHMHIRCRMALIQLVKRCTTYKREL